MLVKGNLFLGGLFFFPKDQGQEESTPRVVGGKKNNKEHRRLGSTAPLASSVIISAWLGCRGNLHNTILTPSLQLSITLPRSVHVRALPPEVSLLPSHPPACSDLPFPLSGSVLVFVRLSQKKKKQKQHQEMDFISFLS